MDCIASVIIPVYNAEKTLRRCVESLVLGQERNIEVILSEDCSKDGSWALCQELAEEFPNVRCIRNARNSGVSHTRNRALGAAQGEYILFVDSDDWVSEQYAARLLKLARENRESLCICGQHFLDKVHNTRREYRWNDRQGETVRLGKESFYDLSDRFLLQQLWNKIFRRDIIEKHHIRFDESQSMGEDFQFVLDYLEAAEVQTCVVLNEPLYYYIRWGNSSLMSKFGPATRENALERFRKLRRICGEDAQVQAQYQRAVENLQQNYIYHAVRAKNLTKSQKLDTIRELVGDPHKAIYRKQRIAAIKEQIVSLKVRMVNLPRRIQGRLRREQQEKKIAALRNRLTAQGFSILSQNCIGGVFYHDMGMQFLSPTVDLFFMEPDFVKFVSNLKHYLDCELQMRWAEEYPVGRLDDIEIHFMHYETCKEAKDAWERRKQRINYERILVLATDRNGFDNSSFELWKQIPYPKVLFTVNREYAEEKGTVVFSRYASQSFVPDLIPGREFYKDDILLNTANELGGKNHGPAGSN